VRESWQLETFVCDHIVKSARYGQPRGFFWATDDDQDYPDVCAANAASASKQL
jgi:hypothetical protein